MTDFRVTQVAVEEWAAPIPPQMQATQVAIEYWSSTTNVSVQMAVTLVAVEIWASTGLASGDITRANILA